MKNIKYMLVGACLVLLFSGCAATADLKTNVLTAGAVDPLKTPAQVGSLLQDNTVSGTLKVLDVRTPEEFQAGCLPGARNIDIKSDSFDKKISELNKDAEYLLYCRSGKRSADAAVRMRQAGFKNISELKGGILAWQEAGISLSQDCQ